MQYFILVTLLGLGLAACTAKSSGEVSPGSAQLATTAKTDTAQPMPAIAEAVSPKSDTIVISEKAAIFIRPNAARIDKEKKKGGEAGFYVAADDYLYYMATAQEFLDSMKVTVVDVSDEKVVKLVGNNKNYQFVKIGQLPALWNIYLFEPGKKVRRADMAMIEEEYEEYFN